MKNKKIAIIGAGATGCFTSLELASRGYSIDLYDKEENVCMKASKINEGKIHLGLIYAMDKSMRTAKTMIDGALNFADYLNRWFEFDANNFISTPFHYCIHNGSLLNQNQIISHIEKCKKYYDHKSKKLNKTYLNLKEDFIFESLVEQQIPEGINPEYISHVIATPEYSLNTRSLRKKIEEAILHHPYILFRHSHEMVSIKEKPTGKIGIEFKYQNSTYSENYDIVLNATWHRRLPFDQQMGIKPSERWSHRYKFGNFIYTKTNPANLTSLTMVQGPFGDIVSFKNGGIFFSWYPVGRIELSTDISPPDYDEILSLEVKTEKFYRAWEELKKRYVKISEIDIRSYDVDPSGGIIYALGTTDIDQPNSRLHNRYEIGIQTKGNYISLDTGKYTLSPLLAVKVAEMIENKHSELLSK